MIDIFYNMSKKWIDDFVISKKTITAEQKILETYLYILKYHLMNWLKKVN